MREDDGFTVVDTGLGGTAEKLIATAREAGGEIRRIALTHGHSDHTGSLDALRERLGDGVARDRTLIAGDAYTTYVRAEIPNRLLQPFPLAAMGTQDRAGVVAAAATLADAGGLESVTLTRLAAALGVRPPSLYAHVAGIEDVRRRLGARGARELADALGQAAAGRAGRDALHATAHAYRAYAHRHPGCYAAAQRRRARAGRARGRRRRRRRARRPRLPLGAARLRRAGGRRRVRDRPPAR